MRLLALLGCGLLVPSLWLGFASDDHFLLAAAEGGVEGASAPFNLYDFVPQDRALVHERIARGDYPWWTADDLSLTFLRPLSSVLFALDHALFGRNAFGYHVHSLLWLALLLAAFARLLKRLLPSRVAWLAYAFLCLDNAHAMATYWISNRHSLVGSALAFWALEAHLDHVQGGRRRSFVLALLAFTAALAASEFSLSCIVFAFALDLFDGERTVRKRLMQSVVWLFPSTAYVACYLWLDRGATGSAAYISPWNVADFAHALSSRVPALLSDLTLNVPSVGWVLGSKLRAAYAVLAVSASGALVWLFRRPHEGHSGSRSPFLPALLLGTFLSLIPAASALPGARQQLAAAFGFAPILATLLLETHERFRHGRTSRVELLVATCLLLSHLLVSPALVLSGQQTFHDAEAKLRKIAQSLDAAPRCVSPEVDVVLLNAPDHLVGVYVPIVRRTLGLPAPRSFHLLSMAPLDQTLEVLDEHSVLLTTTSGAFLESEIERFWRADPARWGGMTALNGLTVRAHAHASSRSITALEVRFERPLRDESLCFVRYAKDRVQRVSLSATSRIELPKERGPSGL